MEYAAAEWLRERGWIVERKHPIADMPKPPNYFEMITPPKEDSPEFIEFWTAYPRKENKASARKAWSKVVVKQQAIDAVKKQVLAGMFSDDPKYVPMASTWLNQERWDNPIIPKRRQAPTRTNALDAFMED